MSIEFGNISIHDFIESFVKGLEARDHYTSGHSIRVAHLGCLITASMGLGRMSIDRVHIAGHLHDIGKIGIPDCILTKPGKLTAVEYNILKQHSKIGADIVKGINDLEIISKIILYHHEWYDGTGYPEGLAGEEIPIESRIISVADAFDAMTSNRSYRKALSIDEAMRELYSGKRSQFDPDVVDVVMHLYKKDAKIFSRICSEHNELLGV